MSYEAWLYNFSYTRTFTQQLNIFLSFHQTNNSFLCPVQRQWSVCCAVCVYHVCARRCLPWLTGTNKVRIDANAHLLQNKHFASAEYVKWQMGKFLMMLFWVDILPHRYKYSANRSDSRNAFWSQWSKIHSRWREVSSKSWKFKCIVKMLS